jgi:flagellar biosynthesis/type III secretory pathway chaperone
MTETERYLVLHALKVKGMASTADVAAITGQDDVAPLLDHLVTEEQAKLRTGRVEGYTLTQAGREAYAELAPRIVTEQERAGLAKAYDAFLPVNARFKTLCTRWQLRPGPDGAQQANDHSEAAYDAAVVADLVAVHAEIGEALAPAVEAVPRFVGYHERFGAALRRVQEGEVAALTRPMSSSYHDVWMELHEDLLLTLGRERDAADGH